MTSKVGAQLSEQPTRPSESAAAWGTVLLLLLLNILSLIDRNLVALMVGPIKETMGVSDFQVSLLQGFAFGIFYACFGVGMGWILDHFSRRHSVFWGVSAWSVCAAACGAARNFGQLLAARIGVGVGEAVLVPAAYVIIASIFPRHRLGFATSVFAAGSIIGGAISLSLGGYVLRVLTDYGPLTVPGLGLLQPWQMAFIVFGLPGLLVAPLIFLVPRDAGGVSSSAPAKGAGVAAETLGSFMSENRVYLTCHFLAFGLVGMLAYAQAAWVPAYLQRVFSLRMDVIGSALAVSHVVGGLAGFLGGGLFVDRWFSRGMKDAHMRYPMYCTMLLTVVGIAAFTVPSATFCILAIAPMFYLFSISGIAGAQIQLVTPSHLRARVSAIYLLVFNLIGLCLGPTLVAAITDFFFADPLKVGVSLMITFAVVGPLAVLCFWLGLPGARNAVGRTGPRIDAAQACHPCQVTTVSPSR